MNKLQQVIGLLTAIKKIALQGIYAETFKGMESHCVATYRKCIATLKTISGFEEIESIAPELADNSTMQEVSFTVEAVLSMISEGEGPTMHVGGARLCMPGMPHMPRMRMHMRGHGPRSMVVDVRRRRHMRHREDVEELQDEMQEKMEEEQERFEDNIEKIEDQVEELQDKIEEIRDQLEERLEEIREKYQEKIEQKMEEIEESEEEGEEDEEDEEKDEPKV